MIDLEARNSGIGGSDAAAALGLSPWRTQLDLYYEKIGETAPLIAPTEPMRWGTLLEPLIAEEYARRTGFALETPPMLRHPEYGFMIGHIDRRVVGQPRILEIKTARSSRGWGEEGSDDVPLHYLAQVHHYLIVTGAEVADVAVLIGGNDFRVYTVERDDEFAGTLIDRECAFWGHVLDRSPPDPASAEDAVRRWGRLANPGAVYAGTAEAEAIDTLRYIRERRADLDLAEQEAKLTVMRALGERGDTLVDLAGSTLATWKLDKGRKAYAVEAREPSRRFLLKD